MHTLLNNTTASIDEVPRLFGPSILNRDGDVRPGKVLDRVIHQKLVVVLFEIGSMSPRPVELFSVHIGVF